MLSIQPPEPCIRIPAAAGALVLAMLLGVPARAVESRPPGPDDRCPVCGMFVATYTSWLATVLFEDRGQVFFDGPKDLFRFLHDPGKYGHRDAAVLEILVTDYYTTRPTRAREAFFVVGSDVIGPMGHELVALRSENDAETFVQDHGGRVLTFEEVIEDEVPE